MKKLICVILVAVMAMMLIPSVSAAAPLTVDLKGRTDVLEGEIGMMNAPANEDCVDGDGRMTDGIFCVPGDDPFFNKKGFDSAAAAKELEDSGNAAYEFKLVDGTVNKYYYEIQWFDLNCDVDSFAIYFSNSNDYSQPNTRVAWWQVDSAFDVLVSQDGGNTWSVAWQSVRFTTKTDADGNKVIDTNSSYLIDQGGDWTHVENTENGYYFYRYIDAKFNQEYKGVTNIAYGCVNPRRASEKDADGVSQGTVNPFNWVCRISEFDVYGKNNKTETTEEVTTAAPETDAPTEAEVTTAAPETDAPTEAAATTAAPEATEAAKDGGCSSSVAFAGIAFVLAAGCALIRRKED